MQDGFQKVDSNKDGFVQFEELHATLGIDASREKELEYFTMKGQSMFDAADVDSNKKLSLVEYSNLFHTYMPEVEGPLHALQAKLLLEHADVDMDNHVAEAELSNRVKRETHPEHLLAHMDDL